MRVTTGLFLVLLASCDVGGGSQLAPFIGRLPSRWLAGIVQSAAGQSIVGAVVRLSGSSSTAVSARSGRFVFFDPPLGTRVLSVDASAATATGTDLFGSLQIIVDVPGGTSELGRPLVLADINSGVARVVPLGPQPVVQTLDDTALGRGLLRLAQGTTVSLPGATGGTILLAISSIGHHQLPTALPPPGTGARLPSQAVFVYPAAAQFGAGAHLTIPNDPNLPANAKAELLRLDPDTSVWSLVGQGTVSSDKKLIAMDNVDLPGGGLYVFSATIAQTRMLAGRVRTPDSVPLAGALVVTVGGVATRANAAGDFQVGPVPSKDGSGNDLSVSLVAIAPCGWEPVSSSKLLLTPASMEIELDTVRTRMTRVLTVLRGRAIGSQRVSVGGPGFGRLTVTDADGRAPFEDTPLGWYGGWATWVDDDRRLFRGFVRGELRSGMPSLDLTVLSRSEHPHPGLLDAALLAVVVDANGGAPLRDVYVQGANGPTGHKGLSNEFGEAVVKADRFGTSTAAIASKVGGQELRSAVSLASLDNRRSEFPLEVLHRSRGGSFERHGALEGSITGGGGGGKTRQLLVRTVLHPDDWFDRVLQGTTLEGMLPRQVDPVVTGNTGFRLGVPLPRAKVTAVEGMTNSGVFVPERLGLADLATGAGTKIHADIALDHAVDQQFIVRGPLVSLDPALSVAALRYRLGAVQSDGMAIDLLPQSGGVTAATPDAVVLVPERTGPFADVEFLVEMSAEATVGNATFSQAVLGQGVSEAAVGAFLALPSIKTPAPESTTASADVVTVTWNAPVGASFQLIELSSVTGNDTRKWQVMLPGDASTFTFEALVPEAPQILAPGRLWVLKVSAFRVVRGVAFDFADSYARLAGNMFSLRPGDRGIGARSSWQTRFRTP